MGKLGGYAGEILKVNLKEKEICTEPIPLDWISRFIGGLGISFKLAYDNACPGKDALEPENVLIFGAGPFVGTLIPGACKTTVVAKTPVSGFLGISGTGHLGMLKFIGYDNLMITGKADHPVYLKIDDNVEICDASDLWGKDTWETTEALWQKLGKQYVVASIGPAGENMAVQASIIVNKYSAYAQSGMGAVMGSKNLKAIAISGSKSISVADPERFSELMDKAYQQSIENQKEVINVFREWGTLRAMGPPISQFGPHEYKNYSEIVPPDLPYKFPLDRFMSEIKRGDISCMGCPIGCKHLIRLLKGDRVGGSMAVSCLVGGFHGFAAHCAVEGWEDAIRCDELCNRLGMDYLSAGAAISFAIELYREKIIDKADTDGLELDWGAAKEVQELLRQMAFGQGFGKILGQGLSKGPQLIGKNSEKYAVHTRGHAIYYDPRRAMSPDLFSDMINASGDRFHAPGWAGKAMTKEFLIKHLGMPPDQADHAVTDIKGYGLARFAKWAEDNATMFECLGQCQMPMHQQVELSVWAVLYEALTGIKMNGEKLLQAAGRVWDIRRMFDFREGRTRKDDSFIARRFVSERLVSNGEDHDPVSKESFDALLTEYYKERGWDLTDGAVKQVNNDNGFV
ncbi:MAG: hypothetical protein KJ826_07485 [Proteobacteria bacterium]|nr:hypothetical protein [Pseudomonadota bacterium]